MTDKARADQLVDEAFARMAKSIGPRATAKIRALGPQGWRSLANQLWTATSFTENEPVDVEYERKLKRALRTLES